MSDQVAYLKTQIKIMKPTHRSPNEIKTSNIYFILIRQNWLNFFVAGRYDNVIMWFHLDNLGFFSFLLIFKKPMGKLMDLFNS